MIVGRLIGWQGEGRVLNLLTGDIIACNRPGCGSTISYGAEFPTEVRLIRGWSPHPRAAGKGSQSRITPGS